jgi:acyl-CoA synthetase (AMP-forming)/AMP-acid ligase II
MSDPRPGLAEAGACTQARYESAFRDRHLVHGALTHWAARKPDAPAILNATQGSCLTWRALLDESSAVAAALLRRGFRKGDFLATSLPLLDEHIVLEYACFRIGVIHVPLDLRLSDAERARCLERVTPKGYVSVTAGAPPQGVAHVWDLAGLGELFRSGPKGDVDVEWPEVRPEDGAQVVFTTGSTGQPKAALLTHRSITSQNFSLGQAFSFSGQRVLVNLPPSHVGGQAELLMTTLFWGATAVTLEVFDPGRSLEAIETYGVTLLGQIPAMFQLEWRHSDYGKRDLSSLQTVACGGQAVPRSFLEKLRTMAPRIGTGLGLTEASGFCTYTELTGDIDRVASGLGRATPLYDLTIRQAMQADGSAGGELADGEIGCVCFRGSQTFAGYIGEPEATAKAISTDGYLYTGDMGFRDGAGLHFAGRSKWMIKPAGYQVFPGDVEDHFCALSGKVSQCGAVGVEHPIWMEAIVAFVEKAPGADLTATELRRHSRKLTAYMRPLHYVILEAGQMPLNRVAKVDMLKLKELAEAEILQLKARGRWRAEAVEEG